MKFDFTESEFIGIFENLKERKKVPPETFSAKEYLKDLVEHVCLFYKDGNKYKYVHKSFQDFFVQSIFLSKV